MERHNHNSDEHSRDAQSQNDKKQINKQHHRTTAVALSILVLASLGLIGFEIISNKESFSENRSIRGSKSLLILSHEKERDGAGLIANLTARNNGSGNEIDALNDTNKVQANKIKALKRQLVEANQKIHEVKGHLFTKGDPSDRSRLAEICQDLVEKERESCEFKEKVEQLEKERQETYQKINRLEHTIDALAAMTDSQRSTKEQAILSFQDQIEQLQNLANAERKELTSTIEELEQTQSELKGSFSEKLALIKNLENEITWQYNILSEKDHEIQSLSQLYTTSEKTMNKQLQDLIVAMELELLKNSNLATEVNVAHARHNAQLQFTKSLEERIVQADEKTKQIYSHFANNTHLLIKEYLDFQGLLDVYSNSYNQLASKNRKLANLVKKEKNKANELQSNLSEALSQNDNQQQRNICLEQELNKTSQHLSALNEKLETEQYLLNQKQQELDILTYSHASLRDQLNERISQLNANLTEEQQNLHDRDALIQNLTINLELEKTRSQELNHMLKNAIVEGKKEQEKNLDLEEELSQKTEIIASLEGRVQDKQTEISELNKQLSSTSSDYAQEQVKTQELHRALVTALQENENELLQLKDLTRILDEHTDTVTLLQDRLSEKKNTIDQLQENLAKIQDDLEEEKDLNEELQKTLAITLARKDAEQERALTLENEVQTNTKKLVFLQDSLADKHHEIRTLLDQIRAFNSDLNQEQERSQSLQKNLEIALAKHDKEFRTAKGMESMLKDNELQIHSLLEQLDVMANKLNSEHQRSRDLELSLVSALSKHDSTLDYSKDLEKSLWENSQKIDEQKQAIERLNQQINHLNDDIELEQNRGMAFKQANDKEAMERFELEKAALEAQLIIDDLKLAVSTKENENQALQNKVLGLGAELDKEINHSLQLQTDISHNDTLKGQIYRLQQELHELRIIISEKEETLSQQQQEQGKTVQEKAKLQQNLNQLQQDKAALEGRYVNQLNLVLKQQELVNQISNELTSQKERVRQLESISEVTENYGKERRQASANATTSHVIGASGSIHLVRNGETLSTISDLYFGTPTRWYDIYNANRDLIDDSYEINPGTKLAIPN
jgi:chromosome segregation ATPase